MSAGLGDMAGAHGRLNRGPLSAISCLCTLRFTRGRGGSLAGGGWRKARKTERKAEPAWGGRADISLPLTGRLGAAGSQFLGQQCARKEEHQPSAERFSGQTQGDHSSRCPLPTQRPWAWRVP